MWIGAISKYDSARACSSCCYLGSQVEGPTFENNFPTWGQLFVRFVRLKTVGLRRVSTEDIVNPCEQKSFSKLCVVACGSSVANLKQKLLKLQAMQLAVASNSFPKHSIAISAFLVRLQPLHLDYGCVVKGRNIISKSTLFIPEA